jgi:hypothetical protein
MIITVKINADTPAGKRLVKELRRYPDCVEFVDSTVVSDDNPEGYVSLKDGFDQIRNHVLNLEYPVSTDANEKETETISAAESAKLAFHKLGEKYNRTFDNKYTR